MCPYTSVNLVVSDLNALGNALGFWSTTGSAPSYTVDLYGTDPTKVSAGWPFDIEA